MSSYDHPEPDYPIVSDYCDCGQLVDEHDDELHAMRMEQAQLTRDCDEMHALADAMVAQFQAAS